METVGQASDVTTGAQNDDWIDEVFQIDSRETENILENLYTTNEEMANNEDRVPTPAILSAFETDVTFLANDEHLTSSSESGRVFYLCRSNLLTITYFLMTLDVLDFHKK